MKATELTPGCRFVLVRGEDCDALSSPGVDARGEPTRIRLVVAVGHGRQLELSQPGRGDEVAGIDGASESYPEKRSRKSKEVGDHAECCRKMLVLRLRKRN